MKKITLVLFLLGCFTTIAQNAPIDFESGGQGATWTWTTFENDSNPPLEVVANPNASGVNTSATVAKFTALTNGQPFAGVESMHGEDIGTFTLSSENSIVTIQVYKPRISDVGIKFAIPSGGSTGEIKVANTLINEWEELTFDFSDVIGVTETMGIDQIIIFSDFAERTEDTVNYFDNITFGAVDTTGDVSLPVDFEDDATLMYEFVGFEGADSSLEANPNTTGENASATVLRSIKTEGSAFFAGTALEIDVPIDFSTQQSISIQTYSPKANIPVRLKLENADASSFVELDVNTTVTDTWETLTYDFSSQLVDGVDYVRAIVFFEFIDGVAGDGSTYYFDTIELSGNSNGGNDAELLPIDFEVDGQGADYTWTTFENGDNPPLEIVENPFITGINTSSTVAKFTALSTGQPFAGVESMHGADLGTFTLSSENSIIKIQVYKPRISDVGIKFAIPNGGSTGEIKVANTLINQWEELTFDFSGVIGAAETMGIDQIIIFSDFAERTEDTVNYFDNITFNAQDVSSNVSLPVDFENDATLMYEFVGFEGADSSLEANPDTSGENISATVLRSIKTEGSAFFAGTALEIDVPIDFSTQQSISIQTYSPKAAIPVRLKLENADASSFVELDVNTTVTDTWETLTYDFSSQLVDGVDYVRAIVFFEFIDGVAGDGSTYYFDNVQVAADTAAEVELPVTFEDDATLMYEFVGFEGADSSLEANPNASGENTSATVLRSIKTEGAQFFAGTALEIDVPIDFSTQQSISIQTYSPKSDIPVRLKLENADASSFVELDVNTTVTDTWETLTYDFSSQLVDGVDYVRAIVFFEFIDGVAGDGSTYYFDNVQVAGDAAGADVELPVTFEDDTTLMYEFVGFEGADSSLEANPNASGENTSATVLRSIKTEGAQFFAGTALEIDVPIDFSTQQSISIQTYSPKADIPVRLKLENADASSFVELDVNTTVTDTWETLTYDFSSQLVDGVDYVRAIVFFEFIDGVAGDGSTYYFDNVQVAGDAAGADVELPVTFEDDATLMYEFVGFEGADSSLEANPNASGENTSATVLRSIKTEGAQFFAGTALEIDVPIDFSTQQSISIQTYSPKADIPVRLKLENADASSFVELDVNTTVTDTWETLTYDFSSQLVDGVDYVRAIVFFEFIDGVAGDGSTYYFDNVQVAEDTNTGEDVSLPVDFEDDATLMYDFVGFEGADSSLEANPNASGENTSATVLRSIKTEGSAFFAGTALEIDVPIDFSVDQGISIQTYSPKADIPVRIKLENADASSFVELDVNTTVTDTWETLTYNFSSQLNEGVEYVRVIVFFEFIDGVAGDGSTYYFDNIQTANVEDEQGDPVTLPLYFEDANLDYDFFGFEGADTTLDGNPDSSGLNPSATVLKSVKTEGAQFFAGTAINVDEPIDFTTSNMIAISSYSPKANIPVKMRLENADNSISAEFDVNTTVVNEWEELVFDFTGLLDTTAEYVRVVVFYEFVPDLPGDGSTYYFDNIGVVGTLSASALNAFEMTVYPNPAIDFWNVTTDVVISNIAVYDVLGKRILLQNPNKTNFRIDATTLKSGIYFLQMNSGNAVQSFKLIKR